MGNNKNNLPDRLVKGGSNRSSEAKVPVTGKGSGRVLTNLNVRWTPRKATIATTLLGLPFLFATVLIFKSGNILIGCVFVGLALFVGLIYVALRYIEKSDF